MPAHARLVLVSGGGWGIGDLEGAIDVCLAGDDPMVACITGRNEVVREKLEQRFGDNERVRVIGFTEQMSDWMAAADVMVHATAGLTVLEAHIRGCPVISYGFSAGHLRANNAAFERFGLAEVARSEHELRSVLRHLSRERRSPDSTFASLPSIASRALTVRPRVRPQPVWRLRAERVATVVSLAAIAVVMLFTVIDRESALQGDRQAARGSHPHRQGQRRLTCDAAAGVAPASPAPARRLTPSRPRLKQPLDPGAGGGRCLRCRGSARRPSARATRPGAWAGTGNHAHDAWRGWRRPHLRRRPAPAGDAGRAGDAARARSRRDLLPRRRAGRAPPGAGRRDRRRGPPGRAALPSPPQPAAPRRTGVPRRRRTRPGDDRGCERAGDRRLPPPLRDLQRRDPARGAPAWLAPGALVALGQGLAAGATAESIARRSSAGIEAGDIVLLHDADYYSARGSWVRTAAALPLILDRARKPRAEIERAAPLRRRRDRPILAAGEGLVEALRHRAPWPVLVEDFPGHGSPSCRGR